MNTKTRIYNTRQLMNLDLCYQHELSYKKGSDFISLVRKELTAGIDLIV
jgi:hypothetical protein